MDKTPPDRLAWVLPILVFFWPFVFFFRRVWTIGGRYWAIGNDYVAWHYQPKVFLLDQLRHGRIPFWAPSEGSGFPFYSNPHVQAFYPLNLLALLYQELVGGFSVVDYQRFTILGVSIFGLGTFFWLRSMGCSRGASFVATTILSVSFKLDEMLRFANSIHTAAWYPWILLGLTILFRRSELKPRMWAGVGLFIASLLMITAGYTYCLYYGVFLFVPFILYLFVSRDDRTPRLALRKRVAALATAGIAFGAALAVCTPYLLKLTQVVSLAAGRGGRDLDYSSSLAYAPAETVYALLFPPGASAEGWVYPGAVALSLIAVGIMSRDVSPVGRLCFVTWFGFIACITWGPRTPVFRALWEFMPGFDRLRVWPRLNIVLVPGMAFLAALGYGVYKSCLRGAADETNSNATRRRIVAVLAIAALAMIVFQFIAWRSGYYAPYWSTYFAAFAGLEGRFLLWSIIAAVLLLLPLVAPSQWRRRVPGWLVAAVLVAAAGLDLQAIGANIWNAHGQPIPDEPRRLVDSQHWYMQSFATQRQMKAGLILGPSYGVDRSDLWHFERELRFWKWAEGQEDRPRRVFLGERDGRKLFFTERLDHDSIAGFLADASRFQPNVTVLSYDGDRLHVTLGAPQSGFLSFIDNWDPDWQVFVDGNERPIEILFETFKSVHVRSGHHEVVFAYRPRFGRWRLPPLELRRHR